MINNLTQEHIIFLCGMFFGIVILSVINRVIKAFKKKERKFEKVLVCDHIDGDTIGVIDRHKKEYKVRLIGANTPETKHPVKGKEYFGKEASEFTKKKLLNKKVYLQKDTNDIDMYGRLLRYVWIRKPRKITKRSIRKKMFNAILITEGYARDSKYNSTYKDFFTYCEELAKQKKRGLWKGH